MQSDTGESVLGHRGWRGICELQGRPWPLLRLLLQWSGAGGSTNVVDITDPSKAELTATLKSSAMLNPWESGVNARRQFLVAVSPARQRAGSSRYASACRLPLRHRGVVDVYDLSDRLPQPEVTGQRQRSAR